MLGGKKQTKTLQFIKILQIKEETAFEFIYVLHIRIIYTPCMCLSDLK